MLRSIEYSVELKNVALLRMRSISECSKSHSRWVNRCTWLPYSTWGQMSVQLFNSVVKVRRYVTPLLWRPALTLVLHFGHLVWNARDTSVLCHKRHRYGDPLLHRGKIRQQLTYFSLWGFFFLKRKAFSLLPQQPPRVVMLPPRSLVWLLACATLLHVLFCR